MVEKIKIADGITLNVISTEKFKTNYLSVNFVNYLDADKVSLYALVPQVLIRGTKKHDSMAKLKIALDELYAASVEGRVYKRGEYQVCGLTASWLADRYAIDGTAITEGALDILEELLFEPYTENGCFSKSYTESEKQDLIDDIRALINNKNSYAVRRCKQEMFKGEAYGISEYGTEESVGAITPESLYKAYNEMLEASAIEIFYVGGGDVAKLTDRIRSLFANRKRSFKPLKRTEVSHGVQSVREVTERISASQGKLSLGFRIGSSVADSEYRAFPVLVEMYANSPVSKLFMNVREKLSLCYYCRAIPDGVKGVMIVSSGIEVANKQKAQDEILAQLEDIKQGRITEDELVLAKKSLKNAYCELDDSPVALEGWYLTRRLSGLDDDHGAVCDRLMEVTLDEVVEAANRIKLDTVYFLEGTQGGEEEEDDE